MNEPAFPNEGFNGWGEPFKGMTLRDYFASKAMQAMLENNECPLAPLTEIPEASYKMADAMLKARGE